MHQPLARRLSVALIELSLVWLWSLPAAHADAGHDHGDATPRAAGPDLPRFAAGSDLFEVVGVVNGRQITLYLDRSTDNSPVKGATLELEFGGSKLAVTPRGEGEFEATLPHALRAGVVPVTVTVVVTGAETDLLAGEFNVAEEVHAAASQGRSWTAMAPWAIAGLAGLAALAWAIRLVLSRRVGRIGGAA